MTTGCYYQKVGSLVVLSLDSYPVSGSRVEVGSLPVGFRPQSYCVATVFGTSAPGYMDASTNGKVTVNANGNAFGTLVFFAAQ